MENGNGNECAKEAAASKTGDLVAQAIAAIASAATAGYRLARAEDPSLTPTEACADEARREGTEIVKALLLATSPTIGRDKLRKVVTTMLARAARSDSKRAELTSTPEAPEDAA